MDDSHGLAALITANRVDGKVTVELALRVLELTRDIYDREIVRRDAELTELRREVAQLRSDTE